MKPIRRSTAETPLLQQKTVLDAVPQLLDRVRGAAPPVQPAAPGGGRRRAIDPGKPREPSPPPPDATTTGPGRRRALKPSNPVAPAEPTSQAPVSEAKIPPGL